MSSLACSVGAPVAEAWLATNFCVEQLPINVGGARSVVSVGTSNLLVLERSPPGVLYLEDTNEDGLPDARFTLATAPGINHGLALWDGYLYASSATDVYRWRWPIDGSFQLTDSVEVVIKNMSSGGHVTRTLAFDSKGQLYVSIGSKNNIDLDSSRARIRRFGDLTMLPINFDTGELFADGLRNEVGLAFDKYDVLWGVENGADQLSRSDLGEDIHNDNPGEELNQFREVDNGKHWGYPWCWSEFFIDKPIGQGAGAVWAWPTTMNTVKTDDQCRADFMSSSLSMQAHSAPLGIIFYEWKEERPHGCVGAFPQSMDGFAFIAFHGSWNRNVPTGYKVVYVEMDCEGNVPAGATAQDLLKHQPPLARWLDGFRPVDVDFDDCGRLIVTSDGSGGVG